MSQAMLAATNLSKVYSRSLFASGPRRVTAFENVDISIERGSLFGLIGESGSGKSSLSRVLIGMEKPSTGRVSFAGTELRSAQMVYQDASSALDPMLSVGSSMAEALRAAGVRRNCYAEETEALFRAVKLDPGLAVRAPHELSGGQRQRVVIARALALKPEFLALDEPVSSLDVSVQAEIIDLLLELKESLGLTYLLVSHDLALVASVCDSIAVMKDGRIVESGTTRKTLDTPQHSYTRKLKESSLPLI